MIPIANKLESADACRERVAAETSCDDSDKQDSVLQQQTWLANAAFPSSELSGTLVSESSVAATQNNATSATQLSKTGPEQDEIIIADPAVYIGETGKGRTLGLLAHYNRVSASVVAALDKFKAEAAASTGPKFYVLQPILVARDVTYPEFKNVDWNRSSTHIDKHYMKHEWKMNGEFYIIGTAPWDNEVHLRGLVRVQWSVLDSAVVMCSQEEVGVYDGGVRFADIHVKGVTPLPFPNKYAPASVAVETHAGYMSPRQLRTNLRTLFKRELQPQTARYAMLVQMFPGDWSAAAVQWRRDESHPDGFQLVAALDFGVGALSTAAKALYALEQPAETHMPAVPQDRWVRHAVVADDQVYTARHTCLWAIPGEQWDCPGVWYENANSPGHPQLIFPKAEILCGPSIPETKKEGDYALNLFPVLMRMMAN